MHRDSIEKRYWLVYVIWIVISAVVVGATIYLPDASRPDGRVDSEEAGRHAIAALQNLDPQKYDGYSVAAVAGSGRGELGPRARWVVLCDRSDRRDLSHAVVVELEADSYRLIRVRKPTQ